MGRFDRIATRLVAEAAPVPGWVVTDFVNQLDISGTPLKKYGGKFQGISTWVVKADVKLYKDRYGWISVSWTVNPVLEGQEWVVQSELSFAPATTGSFAREKFEEFKQVVSVSGKGGLAIFGIDRHVLAMRPDEQNALRDIGGLMSQHGGELAEARRYWKKQAVLFKKQFGMTAMDVSALRSKVEDKEAELNARLAEASRHVFRALAVDAADDKVQAAMKELEALERAVKSVEDSLL